MKKLLIAFLFLSACNPIMAQSRFRNTGVDTAAVQVNLGYTNITTMNIAYPATSIVYLKFYDSYTKPYAKSNTPVLTIQIGTDATLNYSVKSFHDVKFSKGCWMRCVTSILDTANVAVEPATKPLVEITY